MLRALWNESAAFFGNVRSADGGMIEHMAPTAFYPLLAGTPTAHQVAATVTRHLTNPQRFAVWPSGREPPGTPDDGSRPLLQWTSTSVPAGGRAEELEGTMNALLGVIQRGGTVIAAAALNRSGRDTPSLTSIRGSSANPLTASPTVQPFQLMITS